jgi:hypothetical protein
MSICAVIVEKARYRVERRRAVCIMDKRRDAAAKQQVLSCTGKEAKPAVYFFGEKERFVREELGGMALLLPQGPTHGNREKRTGVEVKYY